MSTDAAYQRLALRIFLELSGTIAVPAVCAAFLGQWLDARYGTEPWLLIVMLAVAFMGTAVLVVRKARFYGRAYDRLNESSKKDV